VETFGGLLELKDEGDEGDMIDLSREDDLDEDRILQQLDVDPELRFRALPPSRQVQLQAGLADNGNTTHSLGKHTIGEGTASSAVEATTTIVSIHIRSLCNSSDKCLQGPYAPST
jgi:hypothetical protein